MSNKLTKRFSIIVTKSWNSRTNCCLVYLSVHVWRLKESWSYIIQDVLDGLGWYIFSILPLGSWARIEANIILFTLSSSEDAFCFYPMRSVFTHLLPFSLKGKCSRAVIRLREIINSVKWALAWLSFKAAGLGCYEISHIY